LVARPHFNSGAPPLTPLTLTLATNIRKPALNYMLLMPAELIVDDDYIAAMLRYNVKPGRTRASTRAFINDTTAGFIPPLQATRGEDICFRALPVGAQLFRLSGTCSVACGRDLKVACTCRGGRVSGGGEAGGWCQSCHILFQCNRAN
jgi:hypothetical protein